MSPSGPNYAGTAADGGGGSNVWTSPANAQGTADGVFTSVAPVSGTIDYLNATNFGFIIPTTAVIDGILVEFNRKSDIGTGSTLNVSMIKAGSRAGTPKSGTDIWPTTAAWTSYGGATDLWGLSWTPADINNSGFGFAVQAAFTHGTGTDSIDAMRVTVYWHTAPADVPKRYIYQVFNSTGTYLGNLPNVTSDFAPSQEINTAGSQITIECAVSADTAALPVDNLTDESGNVLTDESLNTLTDEGQTPIIAPGNFTTNALIKNGNRVQVYEYGYWHPNGVCVFLGQMARVQASFGGKDDDKVTVLCYSDGQDLDNHLVRGNPFTYTLDQSQTSENLLTTLSQSSSVKSSTWSYFGQTFTVGVGVTNVGAITLMLSGNSAASVTVTVYSAPTSTTALGSITQLVGPFTGPTAVQFNFAPHIQVTAGTQYFFAVTIANNQGLVIYFSNANPYAGGSMYNNTDTTAGWSLESGNDLYFQTFSSSGSTLGTYSSVDPTTGMLVPVLQDYQAEGGLIQFTSSSIVATGLSLTYQFNTNTVFEAAQAVLSISPNGYYWYVDIGTNILTCKPASTTADLVLTKGRHLDQITLVSTIESIKNTAYVSGGQVSGSNVYVQTSNAGSVGLYGQRLDRLSDNRITDTTTLRQLGLSDVLRNKDEQYQTVVTVVDKTMDTTTLKPGLVVGFNGFGTFVDNLLTQIVRIDYAPEEVQLTLGIMPKRLHPAFERVVRGLIAQQTIANPSSPS